MIATVPANPTLTVFKSELLAISDEVLNQIYIPDNKEDVGQMIKHQQSKALAMEQFDRRTKLAKARFVRNHPSLAYHFENIETLVAETFVNRWYNIDP